MFYPKLFNDDFFDDFFDFPRMRMPEGAERKLYGKHVNGKDDQGRVLRKERYSGAMQRSFYVGEGLDENDVKAKFEDGVLSLTFPKEKEPELPEKKTIMIEG